MDACEHEYESMSRHNRKVPTSFYYRFARDVCAFSDRYACGKVVSVLEGGYSDRALISGAMAHLSGLVYDSPWGGKVDEDWWNKENLVKVRLLIYSDKANSNHLWFSSRRPRRSVVEEDSLSLQEVLLSRG